MDKRTKMWVENAKVARQIGETLFQGAQLHGFDPSWSFNYPDYIGGVCSSVFTIPNYVMGMIAEQMGLKWQWGFEQKHPKELREIAAECKKREDEQNKIMEEIRQKYAKELRQKNISVSGGDYLEPSKYRKRK